MKKMLALGVGLMSIVALAGCANSNATPSPSVTDDDDFKTSLALFVFDDETSLAQTETYAPNLSFPGDAPAYVPLADSSGIFFLSGYASASCIYAATDFTLADGAAKLELKAGTAEDCGPGQIVKPYYLTLPDPIKFGDITSLDVCIQSKCVPAKKLDSPKVP